MYAVFGNLKLRRLSLLIVNEVGLQNRVHLFQRSLGSLASDRAMVGFNGSQHGFLTVRECDIKLGPTWGWNRGMVVRPDIVDQQELVGQEFAVHLGVFGAEQPGKAADE